MAWAHNRRVGSIHTVDTGASGPGRALGLGGLLTRGLPAFDGHDHFFSPGSRLGT